MHLTVHSEGYAELESDALDSIQEHVMEQVDWDDHFRAYGNLISEIANDDLDIHDQVCDVITSHDFYYDVKSRLEELENGSGEGEYWSNNKYEMVENLLNEYDPNRDCGTGEAFTKAVQRAVNFNTPQEQEPAPQVPVIELQRKVTQLEETVATLLQALSMTGRLAGEQFGLAMFSDASKRASEASRNAYQNEVADEQRQTELEAIFETLGEALGGEA
jgi:hypothetical protein